MEEHEVGKNQKGNRAHTMHTVTMDMELGITNNTGCS